MVNQCKAASMHLIVALDEVGSVAEEEAVAVVVAEITDVRKVQKRRIAVVEKASMTLNQKRNHADRVVGTEVAEVAEDEVEVDEVVIDVARERVAKGQEMNREPMVMITTKGIATRDVTEEVGAEVIQGDVHEDSEDAQGVLLHKVQEMREAVIVIMTVVVINIKKINEETETIDVATEVTVVIVVVGGTGMFVMIEVREVIALIVVTVGIGNVVIATVVTVGIVGIVVIEIGMVTVMVKDQGEVDMDVSERLQKARMVMRVARKKVAYAKSPTKWKKLRSRVENQQPSACNRSKGTVAYDNLVYLNLKSVRLLVG